MPDKLNFDEIERAIDSIISFDFSKKYKKVEREIEMPSFAPVDENFDKACSIPKALYDETTIE